MGVSRPYVALRIVELILDVICFGLFAKFGLLFDDSADSLYIYRVKSGLQYVAADGFIFLVQIPFLVALWRHGRLFQHNILNPIASLTGSVLYIAAGAEAITVIHRNAVSYTMHGFDEKRDQYGTGSIFVITGCIYLIGFVYWILKLRKAPHPS